MIWTWKKLDTNFCEWKYLCLIREPQLQYEFEYIKGERDISEGIDLNSRCIYGPKQANVSRIKSYT